MTARLLPTHPAQPLDPRAEAIAARLLAALLLFFGVADAVTTQATLQLGAGFEANPLIAELQSQVGIWWILPKMIGHGILAWMVVRRPTISMLAAMTGLAALLAVVTTSNFALLSEGVGAYTRVMLLTL